MTKILVNSKRYNSKRYNVKLHHVLGHCTWATVKIEGRVFESRETPYKFERAAIDSLLAHVQSEHPYAVEAT